MALTSDEKKRILELRAGLYSYKKIADQTGHSETTVGKVITEATERVVSLRDEGLEKNQIVKQLDYPLVFVSNIIHKASTPKAEVIEAEAKPEETARRLDFKADWEEFKRQHALDIAREELQKRVNGLIEDLEEGERQLNDKKIEAVTWRKRGKAIKRELTDFVLQRIDEIDSDESLYEIESIVDEIDQKVTSLYEEIQRNIREVRELRHRRANKLSDQLQDEYIDIPLFPEFVKKQIKERFLVRNAEEALSVADALTQIALMIKRVSEDNPVQEEKMWWSFADIVKEGGWSYLRRLAAKYREDYERLLVSIDVCLGCDGKLTRKRVGDKVIVNCPSCGRTYQILDS